MKSLLMKSLLILLTMILSATFSKNVQGQEKKEKKIWVKTIDSVLVSEDVLNQAVKDAIVADKCGKEIERQKKQARTNRIRGWVEGSAVFLTYMMFKYWKK